MRMFCIPSFTMIFMFLFCFISFRPAFAGNVSDQLCKLENDAQKAYVSHDRQFLTNLFADEFVHTNFRGGTVDKAGEIDFFTSPKLTMKAATIDQCVAREYGHAVVVTGINNWTGTIFNGNDLSGAYRFTRVYVYRKHRWQIVASQFSKVTS
jgi:Domain of unknown function (DUF4440)